jgi:hypothetical protein
MRQLYIRAGTMKMRKQSVVFLVLGFCLVLSCVTAQAFQGGSDTGSMVADTPRLMTPEPASMLLFGSGLLVIGGVLRRRKRKRVPL